MSSKGRGEASEEHDFYPTPTAFVDAVCSLLPAWSLSGRWLEPSAGHGAFVDGLARAGVNPYDIHANEPFQVPPDALDLGEGRMLRGDSSWTRMDFVQMDPKHTLGRVDHSINNHPFTLFEAHTRHCHYMIKPGGLIVSVARTSVLHPKVRRALRRRLSPLWELGSEQRPSFTAARGDDGGNDSSDYSVFFWRKRIKAPKGRRKLEINFSDPADIQLAIAGMPSAIRDEHYPYDTWPPPNSMD